MAVPENHDSVLSPRRFLLAFALLSTPSDLAGQQIVRGERAMLKNSTIVSAVSFAADSKTVATASNKVIKIWNALEAEEVSTLDGFRAGVGGIVYSPDGRTLATTGFGEPSRIYDTASWKVRHKLQGEAASTRCVAFSSDGKTLATAGYGNVVAFWDVSTGNQLKSFSLALKELRAVAFSPDGTTLACGGHDEAVLWDLKKNAIRARLQGHKGLVHGLVFSRDSKTLFTADSAVFGKILSWDVQSGNAKGELLKRVQIRGVSLSPDGNTLAVVGYMPFVLLLEVASGRHWAQLEMVGMGVEMDSVAYSPNGRLIVAGGADGAARVWDVPQKKAPRNAPAK